MKILKQLLLVSHHSLQFLKEDISGIVVEVDSEVVVCDFLIGQAEIRLPLSADAFPPGIGKGARIQWLPTESGQIDSRCVSIVSAGDEPPLTEDDYDRLEHLFENVPGQGPLDTIRDD